jgi:UDP-N-acetylmuramate dehydrogenase
VLALTRDADLRGFNTYGLPGRAAYLTEARSLEQLSEACRFARDNGLPIAVLGSGSNVIVDEEPFPGLVIIDRLRLLEPLPGDRLRVGAGEELAALVAFSGQRGLGGLERLAGIPGTVGGALYGNAGAFGVQIGDLTESLQYLEPTCSPASIGGADCRFSYRSSAFKRGELRGIITAAVLALTPRPRTEIERGVAETLAARAGKHPPGASCGSYFKNIEAEYLDPAVLEPLRPWVIFGRLPAGRLIQEAGGGGLRVGGASVSEQHCNFLMNDGTATAADLRALAKVLKARVRERFGVELEEEVRYL